MNKRGDETVEAAIVLPVMILTILSLILLMIYFYARLETQCSVHDYLIESAQNREGYSFYDTLIEKRETSSDMGGITEIFLRSEYEESIASIGESEIIRMGELIEG